MNIYAINTKSRNNKFKMAILKDINVFKNVKKNYVHLCIIM